MLVGRRWTGWGRAWAHTKAYTRGYFGIGLISAVIPPLVFAHFFSLLIVVPGAFVANLFFVRLFPKKSWTRERWRGWLGGFAGLMLIWVGTILWLSSTDGRLPRTVRNLGDWAAVIYMLSIPVLFSNLGVLIGYLPAHRPIPPSRSDPSIPRAGSSWPP